MTEEERSKCKTIIHTASTAAAAAGASLSQLPGVDNSLLVPIQLTMTISLGKVFGRTISESTAKAAIASAAATTVGRTISQVLVGWIPGLGNAINAATAASLTETIGWALATEFDEGLL